MAKVRPQIINIKTGVELKKWYWLKAELVDYCRQEKLSYSGKKFAILDRIGQYIDKGEGIEMTRPKNSTSAFNWAKEELTLATLITENYSNGQNSRAFFTKHCGEKFKFSIAFMAWMKSNVGKTLNDAVFQWKMLEAQKLDKDYKSKIPSGNQFNQYVRDFFLDNPEASMKDARRCWKLKKALPLGKHVYERSDLKRCE